MALNLNKRLTNHSAYSSAAACCRDTIAFGLAQNYDYQIPLHLFDFPDTFFLFVLISLKFSAGKLLPLPILKKQGLFYFRNT